MISLDLPQSDQKYFILVNNKLVGPLTSTGSLSKDVVSFRSKWDRLEQGLRYYGENSVKNSQIIGDLSFSPISKDLVPNPTTQYPFSVQWKCQYKSGNYWYGTTLTPRMGLADTRITWYTAPISGNTCIYTYLTKYDVENQKIVIYEIDSLASHPHHIDGAYVWEISIGSLSGNYIQTTQRYRSWIANLDYVDPRYQTYDDLLFWLESQSKLSVAAIAPTSRTFQVYKGTTEYSLSLSDAKDAIDSLIRNNFYPDEFPIEEVPYGDLAQDASSQVNANNVNMVAFLRDLRHPTEMIPKLKNLSKLKSWANDYLSVQYGILPTISDLQNIMEACKARKPFLDKNGFSVYTASSSSESSAGFMTYRLEQRIKLAIHDEDVELFRLINLIDSAGFLPSLERIWDLIPYSFVLDWFIDVGNLLERVDTQLRLLRYDIRYVTMSRKRTYTLDVQPTSALPLIGTLERKYYHRWVSDQCPVPPLSLQTTFQDFSHWLESTALLVQRRK